MSVRSLFSPKYSYRKSDGEGTFLEEKHSYPEDINTRGLEHERIFCFWTGDNPMSASRQQCFNDAEAVLDGQLVLVSPAKLESFVKPEYPLHKAYPYLSLVHKADYLRCYFMHHYGGGYTDIKQHTQPWKPAFNLLRDSGSWVVGYREVGKRGVAPVGGRLGGLLRKNWRLLIGNCSYICKPYTSFTYDWYTEQHRRLDGFYDRLVENPGNVMGDNEGYPIRWTEILGDIFHPLCLKYSDRILQSDVVKPCFKTGYR